MIQATILMSDLADKKCIPCEGGIPAFDLKEIHKYLKKIDGWNVKSNEDKSFYLIKEFKFKNFEKSKKRGCLKLLLFHNFRPMQILNMLFKRPQRGQF